MCTLPLWPLAKGSFSDYVHKRHILRWQLLHVRKRCSGLARHFIRLGRLRRYPANEGRVYAEKAGAVVSAPFAGVIFLRLRPLQFLHVCPSGTYLRRRPSHNVWVHLFALKVLVLMRSVPVGLSSHLVGEDSFDLGQISGSFCRLRVGGEVYRSHVRVCRDGAG